MALEVLHVAERIHADAGTDGSDDERHDDGELVDAQLRGKARLVHHGSFKPDGDDNLNQGENEGQDALVANGVRENERTYRHLYGEVHHAQSARPFSGKLEVHRARAEVHDGKDNRENTDGNGKANRQDISNFVGAYCKHEQSRNTRHHN